MKAIVDPSMVVELIRLGVNCLHTFLIYFLLLFGLFSALCVMCSDVYLHDNAQRMNDANPMFFFPFSNPLESHHYGGSLREICVCREHNTYLKAFGDHLMVVEKYN